MKTQPWTPSPRQRFPRILRAGPCKTPPDVFGRIGAVENPLSLVDDLHCFDCDTYTYTLREFCITLLHIHTLIGCIQITLVSNRHRPFSSRRFGPPPSCPLGGEHLQRESRDSSAATSTSVNGRISRRELKLIVRSPVCCPPSRYHPGRNPTLSPDRDCLRDRTDINKQQQGGIDWVSLPGCREQFRIIVPDSSFFSS